MGKHEDAVLAYEAGLEGVASDERLRRCRLWCKIAKAQYSQRGFDAALLAYTQAERSLGDEAHGASWWQEWIDVQLGRMWLHYWRGDADALARLAESNRGAVDGHATASQRAHFFHCLTLMAHRRDRYVVSADTLATAEAALAASRASADVSETATHEFGLGFTRLWHGDHQAAEAHFDAALTIAERTGEVLLQARCLTYLAITCRVQDRIDDTRAVVSRATDAAAAAETLDYSAVASANLAWIAWREGRLAEAVEHGRAAVSLWQTLPAPYPFQWTANLPLLATAVGLGRHAEIAAYARDLLAPTQQRLPDRLADALERAVRDPTTASTVVDIARDAGLL
jgi:tetratricopeptide (TPR) repeat protein